MSKICFVNGKGGVGKTTLSVLVAATLNNAGHSTSIFDCDPQRSAQEQAKLFDLPVGDIGKKFVIYDTMPELKYWKDAGIDEIIRAADLVILVATPSPVDLATTAESCQVVKKMRDPNKPTRIVFNSVVVNSRVAQTINEIAGTLGFPVLSNRICRRQTYQNASINGWGDLTTEAREELLNLTLEILSVL